MVNLVPGGNTGVDSSVHQVEITYATLAGADIDVSAFLLGAEGKVRGDGDMCFFGQVSLLGGAVQLIEAVPGRTVFSIHLANIDPVIERIALTATIYENKAAFSQVSTLNVKIAGTLEAPIDTAGMQETALILGEFYRRQGSWKFRCVAQGFAGGLEPLAKHFGVEVAAAEPPAASPKIETAKTQAPKAAAPKISLSKITLDKKNTSISLEKRAEGFGEIKVNLKWTKNTKGGGFFSRKKETDLDVGCLFEMQDGEKSAVQALGNRFGSFNTDPYIHLMGDDRTGESDDGEWLRINGKHWDKIKRVLVYAFIYEGAPNWSETDGVITIYAPDQPPIEVRLNEEGGRSNMCAIALLENVDGNVKINRLVKFYDGHEPMDRANNWGMRWKSGSK